ncbi:SMI1/KNR4 family protein [Posidoniimonas polymericola]|uniref:SMI1/KNR4 family protein n=1 Tax=Posidoniimonas polymericola TaxID=2528002 RepID=UPI0018D36428
MDEEFLVSQLLVRANDAEHRHDFSHRISSSLPPPASAEEIASAEVALSLNIPRLLKALLTQIANGGFGPGYGLLGTTNGHSDSDGRTLLELRNFLRSAVESTGSEWNPNLLPICGWGSSVWSCVDCSTTVNSIFTLDEDGFTQTPYALHSWLEDWCKGVRLWDTMFEFEEVEIINPFTREVAVTRKRLRAV